MTVRLGRKLLLLLPHHPAAPTKQNWQQHMHSTQWLLAEYCLLCTHAAPYAFNITLAEYLPVLHVAGHDKLPEPGV